MAIIETERAVDGIIEREDAVRDASATFDEEMIDLKDLYGFTDGPESWAAGFGARVAARNKEYRLNVKQELQAAAHNLKYIYADGGRNDTETTSQAMRVLVAIMIRAIKAKNRVRAQLSEYKIWHDFTMATSLLSVPDRLFMRKSFPDLRACLAQLETEAKEVKDIFDEHKQALYVIAFEHELARCQVVMSARKTTKERVQSQARPVFQKLHAMLEERAQIIKESEELGESIIEAWFSAQADDVAMSDYHGEQRKFESFISRINAHGPAHNESFLRLDRIAKGVVWAPRTLPGPDGQEIPIATLRNAFGAYETIHGSCESILQPFPSPTFKMRFFWILILSVLAVLAFPLFAAFTPYLLLNYFKSELLCNSTRVHVDISSRSFRDAGMVVACSTRPLSIVPFACATLHETAYDVSIEDVGSSQLVYFAKLVRHAPRPTDFIELTAVFRAAEIAQQFSDVSSPRSAHILNSMDSVDDTNLRDIVQVSSSLAMKLLDITTHLELFASRICILHYTAFMGIRLATTSFYSGHRPINASSLLAPIATLSVDATRTSAELTEADVDAAISLADALISSINLYNQRLSPHLRCRSMPPRMCRELSPLYIARGTTLKTASRLASLKRDLNAGFRGRSIQSRVPTQAELSVLENQMETMHGHAVLFSRIRGAMRAATKRIQLPETGREGSSVE
ncbi:hypothetical protein PYCCODRAFT_1379541 [Trametes coccinea BRFM310]|uniref:Uncharacterized protein n=1 Tax=Trametes coccinea (strain BRFM310) TaxID=1353009 RepID=A0A1Y2I768_TRAC3|nr:hypothetical protein PYCCODRAFT_1379541 [Trametes coccinea BRFM310]